MTTIVTRIGKGSSLSWAEMDANLNNINNDKLEAGFPASDVANTPAGNITATNVQGALQELDGDIQGHINNPTNAHNSTAIDFLQSGTGATTRTVDDKLSDIVSVKDFGAIGNGVTDDTAAIQAALNQEVPLYFPDGTYLITNLTLPSYVNITGFNATIKKKDNTTGDMFSGNVLNSNWTIKDITFDNNWENQTVNQLNYIFRCQGLESTFNFDSCIFRNQEYNSIRVDGSTVADDLSYVSITNCKFLGGQEGTALVDSRYVTIGGASQSVITGNIFDLQHLPVESGICGVATILLTTPNTVALVISNNFFTDVGRCAANRLGAVEAYAGAGGVIVTGNRFVRAYGRGISTKANIKSSVVTNNIVDGTITDGVNEANGITMSGTADDITIGSGFICSNNVVQDAAGIGFNLIGDTLAPGLLSEVVISNNICRNSVIYNYNVEGYNNVVCTGNISYNSGSHAFRTENITGEFIFSSNLIDTTLTQSGLTLFDDDFTALTATITGNVFRDIALYGIAVTSSASVGIAGFTMSNNRFENVASSGIRFGGQTKASFIANNTFVNCATPFTSLAASDYITATKNYYTTANPPSLTIASDAITVWNDVHTVATEGAAATDDLSTINGGYNGRMLTLVAASNSNDIVLKDGTGNLRLAGDFTLTHSEDTITLMYIGTTWREISRSDNTV